MVASSLWDGPRQASSRSEGVAAGVGTRELTHGSIWGRAARSALLGRRTRRSDELAYLAGDGHRVPKMSWRAEKRRICRLEDDGGRDKGEGASALLELPDVLVRLAGQPTLHPKEAGRTELESGCELDGERRKIGRASCRERVS